MSFIIKDLVYFWSCYLPFRAHLKDRMVLKFFVFLSSSLCRVQVYAQTQTQTSLSSYSALWSSSSSFGVRNESAISWFSHFALTDISGSLVCHSNIQERSFGTPSPHSFSVNLSVQSLKCEMISQKGPWGAVIICHLMMSWAMLHESQGSEGWPLLVTPRFHVKILLSYKKWIDYSKAKGWVKASLLSISFACASFELSLCSGISQLGMVKFLWVL